MPLPFFDETKPRPVDDNGNIELLQLQTDMQFIRGYLDYEDEANALVALLETCESNRVDALQRYADFRTLAPQDSLRHLLLNMLASMGDIIDWGSTIVYAWLTPQGQLLLDSLRWHRDHDNYQTLFPYN